MKDELRKMLTERSFKFSTEPKFKLTSGAMSNFYVDCKSTTLYGPGAVLIGNVMFGLIKNLDIVGIGGLTLGADPIAVATSIISTQNEMPLTPFIIRKQAKEHGTRSSIEGNVHEGNKVVIVEDVITTGGSTLKAISKAEEFGLHIVKVISLIDREEGGVQNIKEKTGYDVEAIFTKSDLENEYYNATTGVRKDRIKKAIEIGTCLIKVDKRKGIIRCLDDQAGYGESVDLTEKEYEIYCEVTKTSTEELLAKLDKYMDILLHISH